MAINPDIATGIWDLKIQPKLKHFMWRIASRAIGVAANLRHRHIDVNPYCARCCTEIETADHVFFTCPYAEVLTWRTTGVPVDNLCDPTIALEDKLRHILQLSKNRNVEMNMRLLPFWVLWTMEASEKPKRPSFQ